MWDRGPEDQAFPNMSHDLTTTETTPVVDAESAKALRVSITSRRPIYAIS
jgi:hypothetical protein